MKTKISSQARFDRFYKIQQISLKCGKADKGTFMLTLHIH